MYFTPEYMDEIKNVAVSKKLDRPLFNLLKNFCRESNQTKSTTLPFQIDDYPI